MTANVYEKFLRNRANFLNKVTKKMTFQPFSPFRYFFYLKKFLILWGHVEF